MAGERRAADKRQAGTYIYASGNLIVPAVIRAEQLTSEKCWCR